MPSAIPRPREFVRQLPAPSAVPHLYVDDYTPREDREELLNALADEGCEAVTIRKLSRHAVTQTALKLGRAPTDLELAQAMLNLVHDLVQYGEDSSEREQYTRAVVSLMPVEGMAVSPVTGKPKGRGDCDDMAILFSALARCAGLHADVIWVDQPGAPFNHVAAVACTGDAKRCYWVETTLPGAKVGETTAEAIQRLRATGRKDFGT